MIDDKMGANAFGLLALSLFRSLALVLYLVPAKFLFANTHTATMQRTATNKRSQKKSRKQQKIGSLVKIV